jgi:hypothetical protein
MGFLIASRITEHKKEHKGNLTPKIIKIKPRDQ